MDICRVKVNDNIGGNLVLLGTCHTNDVSLSYLVGHAPEFVKKLSNTKAPAGGEAVFSVQADGKPPPDIVW